MPPPLTPILPSDVVRADQRAGQEALACLVAPLIGAVILTGDDPLFAVVATVAQALGHTPIQRGQASSLAELAQVNGLRLRSIRLQDAWWHSDAGPFLLLRAHGPVALLPRQRGYDLFDPAQGPAAPLNAKRAAALDGEAWQLYATLPDKPLSGNEIAHRVLLRSRADTATVVLLSVAIGLLALGAPMATDLLVNWLIPGHDLPDLVAVGIVLLVMALTSGMLRLAVQFAILRIEGHAGARLQAAVMDRLLRLPARFFQRGSVGELAQRTLAIQAIEQAVGGAIVASIMAGLAGLIAMGLMFWYSAQLAGVALVLILLMGSVTLLLGLLRQRCEMALLLLNGRKMGLLLHLTHGIAKLHQAMAEERAFLRWARLQAETMQYRLASETLTRISELVGKTYTLLATAAIFLVIYFLADGTPGKPFQSALPLGTLTAFLTAFAQANLGITNLAGTVVQLATLKPLYRYAAPILEAIPENGRDKAAPGLLTGAITLRDVHFRYTEHTSDLFAGLSIQIAAGDHVAIVGASGSGKSTLIRLLLGFEAPQLGSVLLDGQDLRTFDIGAIRRQMGVVLQNGRIMPATLLDNILGAQPGLTEQDAWRAAAQVGLAEDIGAMPMGMQTLLADSGSMLSGGQVQRLLLARALVSNPRILLLDEATSALDNQMQARVMQSIEKLGMTRIVIAHRLSTIAHADWIIVLVDGQIKEIGRYEELLRLNGPFSQMAARQRLNP